LDRARFQLHAIKATSCIVHSETQCMDEMNGYFVSNTFFCVRCFFLIAYTVLGRKLIIIVSLGMGTKAVTYNLRESLKHCPRYDDFFCALGVNYSDKITTLS